MMGKSRLHNKLMTSMRIATNKYHFLINILAGLESGTKSLLENNGGTPEMSHHVNCYFPV